MRPKDVATYDKLRDGIATYEKNRAALPGIADSAARHALLLQMVDSVHRVNYPGLVQTRKLSAEVANPTSIAFEPVKAAELFRREGSIDEAAWLIFLFVHFGKHRYGGWRYLKEVYAGDGPDKRWTWAAVTSKPKAFRKWLSKNAEHIGRKSEPGGFGNHRKYESLDAEKPNGTAAVVESYVDWISPPRTHAELFSQHLGAVDGDPKRGFASLYASMAAVHRFGRTAKFDYLTMLGKLKLVAIVPDRAYLREATGPRKGANLLFGGGLSADDLEARLQELDACLGVGMQVWEDSLCNWQKKPKVYEPFRG